MFGREEQRAPLGEGNAGRASGGAEGHLRGAGGLPLIAAPPPFSTPPVLATPAGALCAGSSSPKAKASFLIRDQSGDAGGFAASTVGDQRWLRARPEVPPSAQGRGPPRERGAGPPPCAEPRAASQGVRARARALVCARDRLPHICPHTVGLLHESHPKYVNICGAKLKRLYQSCIFSFPIFGVIFHPCVSLFQRSRLVSPSERIKPAEAALHPGGGGGGGGAAVSAAVQPLSARQAEGFGSF